MKYEGIMAELKVMSNAKDLQQMKRFGINIQNAYGISVTKLRKFSKQIGKNHSLAQQLWSSGVHEARILSGIIEEPDKVTEAQMERWAKGFNSWDIVDLCCNNVFRKTKYGYKKCFEWTSRKEEFVKRCGFALMAYYAWNDRNIANKDLEKFFPVIKKEAADERNFVKKAVNWALRDIGKRNAYLNKKAIKTALEIQKIDSRGAKWVARDALRELQSDAVQRRLRRI